MGTGSRTARRSARQPDCGLTPRLRPGRERTQIRPASATRSPARDAPAKETRRRSRGIKFTARPDQFTAGTTRSRCDGQAARRHTATALLDPEDCRPSPVRRCLRAHVQPRRSRFGIQRKTEGGAADRQRPDDPPHPSGNRSRGKGERAALRRYITPKRPPRPERPGPGSTVRPVPSGFVPSQPVTMSREEAVEPTAPELRRRSPSAAAARSR